MDSAQSGAEILHLRRKRMVSAQFGEEILHFKKGKGESCTIRG